MSFGSIEDEQSVWIDTAGLQCVACGATHQGGRFCVSCGAVVLGPATRRFRSSSEVDHVHFQGPGGRKPPGKQQRRRPRQAQPQPQPGAGAGGGASQTEGAGTAGGFGKAGPVGAALSSMHNLIGLTPEQLQVLEDAKSNELNHRRVRAVKAPRQVPPPTTRPPGEEGSPPP